MEWTLSLILGILIIVNIILAAVLLKKLGIFSKVHTKSNAEASAENGEEEAALPQDVLVAILTAAAVSTLEAEENKRFRVVSFRPLDKA